MMCLRKTGAAVLLVLLIASGCADPHARRPEETPALSVAARFLTESGAVLQGGAARFSAGENGGSCPVDSSGEIYVSGLPRSGELLLTVSGQQHRDPCSMILSLSEGAVTDATTGEDGVGHVTIRRDTAEISLIFVLTGDGALTCTLWLDGDL